MSDDTPLPEALRQVERVLRSREHKSGATIDECADVVARAADEIKREWLRNETQARLLRSGAPIAMPKDHVAVPVAELEALREWRGEASMKAIEALIARIPEPPRCAHDGPLNWLPGGKYQCVACSAVLVLREDAR